MIFILDTDVYSLVTLPDSPENLRLHTRVLGYSGDYRVTTTIVTYEEQSRGWLSYAAKSKDAQHQVKAYQRLKRHLLNYTKIEVLDFTQEAAQIFMELRTSKLRLGTPDLKIAAIALANKAILLSRNLQHFQKIPGLQVDDWTV